VIAPRRLAAIARAAYDTAVPAFLERGDVKVRGRADSARFPAFALALSYCSVLAQMFPGDGLLPTVGAMPGNCAAPVPPALMTLPSHAVSEPGPLMLPSAPISRFAPELLASAGF
jgi:hypothetical protein